ncbi:MAG: alkaline phosphatase family protein [Candidatus Omnitrophica bacterium]|nr:alkaline phosphatase family protein [Candidatus Omnitrophota bacterium]
MRPVFWILSAAAAAIILGVFLGSSAPSLEAGPMVGAVTDRDARVWLRTVGEKRLNAYLWPGPGLFAVRSFQIQTQSQEDFTAHLIFDDLVPDRRYRYLICEGLRPLAAGTFATDGPRRSQKPLTFIFGSCFKPIYRIEKGEALFEQMAAKKADLVFFLGDFPYAKGESAPGIRQRHLELRRIPGFSDLTASTPTLAIWSDHDYGMSDGDGTYPNKAEALGVFKEYWANASYGTDEEPGVFGRYRYGPADFFLLDERYQALKTKDNPRILGENQWRWLMDGLTASDAPFKVIVSDVPLTRDNPDAWGGNHFLPERERLLDFNSQKRISGVFMISGDIHRVDVHRVPLKDGRFFYDFTSSPMSNVYKSPPPNDQRPPEMIYAHGETHAYCTIELWPQARGDESALCFRVFSGVAGEVHEEVLRAVDLGMGSNVGASNVGISNVGASNVGASNVGTVPTT